MSEEITQEKTEQANQSAEFARYWCGQLDAYHEEFGDWEKKCERIIKRYRDDRDEKSDGTNLDPWRFNSLWSNIQTLSPAIYTKPPKPNVERRYLDKDPMARFASMTLERSLDVTIQQCGFHSATKKAMLDYLLCGRGTTWGRYEPTYGTPEDLGQQPSDDEGTDAALAERSDTDDANDDEAEAPEAPRPVTWEKVYTDYVNWKNFRHSPAPVWEEVTWVAKREYLSRRELRARFKGIDPVTKRPIADLVPLQSDGGRKRDNDGRFLRGRRKPMAEVWEIWDKSSRQVIFLATQYTDAVLERTDDPLSLQDFWPCPKPIYATTTNETLVPVPDYVEYQDQARELDNLTARIKALTDAVRVNGVYDASYPELKRILQESSDNRLIGVANWAALTQKGGLPGALSFIPIKDVVDALIRLYEARDRVKADMAEITGLSDIIRGQAQGGAKTATEQRIKGQFATLRLQDRQAEVARFCRDSVAISAEIIAEQFSQDILAQMTGMVAFIAGEVKASLPPAPPMQPPMIGHNGGPPFDAASPVPGSPGQAPMVAPGGAPMAPGQPAPQAMPQASPGGGAVAPAPPPPDPDEIAQKVFAQAVDLLKNDKMRTFRIDIETDSTVAVDKQADKESVVEMFTAVGGFLEKSAQIGQMVPQMVPALGQALLFAFRKFGVGRDVEGAFEAAIDHIDMMAKNPAPKPPSPEQLKAQVLQQQQESESQRVAAQAQIDQQKSQAELERVQQQHQIELEQLNLKLAIEVQKGKNQQTAHDMDAAARAHEAQIAEARRVNQAVMDQDAADREASLAELTHSRSLEALAAKASAQQSNGAQA